MILPLYAIIDLKKGTIKNFPIKESLFRSYLGGKTLGSKLLMDMTRPGLDPLAPECLLIVNTGPMNGTGAPSSSRFNMSFKNVLTGGIASSNCGGQFGVMLKRAGYDGLIIKGCAESPVYIEIVDGNISIKDAAHLWGKNAEETQEEFDRQHGKLVIGPAGENLVKYACAVSGERVAGRCGAGAVMGSKNLKALVAYGTQKVEIADKPGFDAYIKKWTAFLKNHPMTGSALPLYGSAGLVNKANASGALPTHNFSKGRFEKAKDICGETLAETRLTRNSGCISCPIRCERRVMVDGKEVKGPEFETVGLFGSNMDNADLDIINQINYQADILGMDTISLAGTIAFAMELQEKGMADFGLTFGNIENLPDVIDKIAMREGKFSDIADGSLEMSKKYGGEDFAIHAKGLELASYEPRRSVGMGLGYATSNRGGCHLNGGYLAILESVGVMSTGTQVTKGKPELTIFMQNAMEAMSSAGFCLFTSQAIIPSILFRFGPSSRVTKFAGKFMVAARGVVGIMWKFIPGILPFNTVYLLPHAEALKLATGIKMTSGKMLEIGDRGYNIERLYNLREGLTAANDSLPGRLTKTPQVEGQEDTVVRLDKMLPVYYRVRGWDKDGVPTAKKRKKLEI